MLACSASFCAKVDEARLVRTIMKRSGLFVMVFLLGNGNGPI
jgi:hypothetical protein